MSSHDRQTLAAPQAASTPRHNGPVYLLIAIAVLLVFGQAITFEFVRWDDRTLIQLNPYVAPPTLHGMVEAWKQPYQHLYIPLTYNVWAAIAAVATTPPDPQGFTLNPFVFHFANIALHCLGAFFVYHILLLVLGQKRWIAAAGAVFWAIHPIQVEAVAWATGTKDVLSGLLALTATWLYLSAARAPQVRGNALRYATAAILILLASLAKPGVVGIPLLAIVLDLLVLGRPWRQVALCAWPLVLAVIPSVLLTLTAQPAGMASFVTPPWTRPLIAGHALATYLQKIVLPDTFTVDYGLTPRRVMASTWGHLAWLVPVAVTAAIFACRSCWRMLLAAWLIFLACVGPVLGLVPFIFQYYSTVADRYVYLSMLGVAIAFAYAMTRLPAKVAATICVSVCLALSVRAAFQVAVWQDTLSLGQHMYTANPASSAGYNLAGTALVDEADLLRKTNADPRQIERTEFQALELMNKSVEVGPENIAALNGLSMLYTHRGDIARALALLERAADAADRIPPELAPPTADRLNIAKVCINLKQYARAEQHLRRFLVTHPDSDEARKLLAGLPTASTQP